MTEFPHLPLPKKTTGPYSSPKGGGKIESPITAQNLRNRIKHGNKLKTKVKAVLLDWEKRQASRLNEDLPLLPNQDIPPIFLQIDSKLFDADSLASFGIEVISEEVYPVLLWAARTAFIKKYFELSK